MAQGDDLHVNGTRMMRNAAIPRGTITLSAGPAGGDHPSPGLGSAVSNFFDEQRAESPDGTLWNSPIGLLARMGLGLFGAFGAAAARKSGDHRHAELFTTIADAAMAESFDDACTIIGVPAMYSGAVTISSTSLVYPTGMTFTSLSQLGSTFKYSGSGPPPPARNARPNQPIRRRGRPPVPAEIRAKIVEQGNALVPFKLISRNLKIPWLTVRNVYRREVPRSVRGDRRFAPFLQSPVPAGGGRSRAFLRPASLESHRAHPAVLHGAHRGCRSSPR